MQWSIFLPAALLLVITPGAGTLCVWRAFHRRGWRGGILALMGLLLGDMMLILSSALGLAALLAANPQLFTLLRWGGAAYLIWLACQCWRGRNASAGAEPDSSRHDLWSAWLVTVGNPKAIVFFMAFLPQFLPEQQASLSGFIQLGIVFCLLNMLYLSTLLWFGKKLLGQRLASYFSHWVQRLSAVMFILLGVRLLWERQPP